MATGFLFRVFQHECTTETCETIHSYGCVGVLEIKESAVNFVKKPSPIVDDTWACVDFDVSNTTIIVPEDVLKIGNDYYKVMAVALNPGDIDSYRWQVSTRIMQMYEFSNHVIYNCSNVRG